MNMRSQARNEAHTNSHRSRPFALNLLQRKCACGGTPGPAGECAECREEAADCSGRWNTEGPA